MVRSLSKPAQKKKVADEKEDTVREALAAYEKACNDASVRDEQPPSVNKFHSTLDSTNRVPLRTFQRRVRGGPSRAAAALERSHLNADESQTLVNHLLHLAERGFPIGRSNLCHSALSIIKQKDPNTEFLGKNWADRFIERHRDQLHVKWTANLETIRAAAVNPVSIGHWFDLCEVLFNKYKFKPKNIWGMDESNLPFGTGQPVKVISRRGGGMQHIQRDGAKENVTLIVTICADGEVLPPVCIFKGKRLDPRIQARNPLEARLVLPYSDLLDYHLIL